MTVESGTLEDRIYIYKIKSTVDKTKFPTESDLELIRGCWANIRSISVREQIRGGLEIADQTYTIKCRYFSGLNASDCRIKFNDLYYMITSISPNKHEDELIISVELDTRLNKNEGYTT